MREARDILVGNLESHQWEIEAAEAEMDAVWMRRPSGVVGQCRLTPGGPRVEREKRFRVYKEAPGFRPGPCGPRVDLVWFQRL